MKLHRYFVYILANSTNSVLYIGVTNNLSRRLEEHEAKVNYGFTQKYNINKLVYFEEFKYINDAILREKRLKKWYRRWKEDLVKSVNPKWEDIRDQIPF